MTTLRRLWRLTLRIAVCLTLWSLTLRAAASGVDPTKISLPKGPGSIEGLGRSFVPSLASGTAGFGVDIVVPPAIGGFGPALALEYDAGGGVSELGLGWRLGGLPSIRRRVDEGLPRFDTSDAFEISGIGMPSDLLEVTSGVFRPQHESGAFVRVQRSSDASSWEARVKNGFTYRFGGDGYTEEENGNVVTYLLREQHDLHGHVIRYVWDTSEGHALLQTVTWNDFSEATRIQANLVYEARPDVYQRFSSGIRQVVSRRLKSVEVTYGGQLVRRYTLGYSETPHSRLTTVDLVGTDGTTGLPQLALEYTEPSFAADGQVVTMTSAPGRSPAEADVDLADLNGDSLPDLLVTQAGAYRSYINHDGVFWKAAQDWGAANSPSLALSSIGVQLADLDGDGAIDLVAKSGTTSFRYFPGNNETSFLAAVSITTVPNFTFEDPDVRMVDMDGDRRTDVVITTAAGLAVGYNLSGRDWTLPETIGAVDPTQPLRFSDGGATQLCDINGDRVQDFCYLRSGSLVYWLGRGRGRFEAASQASGIPSFDSSSPWELHDLNGDGWVDLVHVGVTQVEYALAQAEGAFEPPRTVSGVPNKGPNVSVTFADMNGSSTTDIVWVDPTATADTAWRYLELFPDGRGGLLKSIANGLGKVTRITYEPAALSAARARDEGRPWTSRMNVAMPVVKRVEVDSSLGDPLMVSEYLYRDGTWDPKDRTFAAFAGGIQREVGDEYSPTLVTENTFDTGLVTRVLRGSPVTIEQRDEADQVFSHVTNSYTTRSLETALDGRAVEYAYQSAERVEHVEASSMPARTTFSEWVQDAFGNVIEERKWGEIVGDDYLAGNDEAIAIRTYANNELDWILGYVATEEITDAAGNRASLERHYYDGEPFEGLALGQVVRGDHRRSESWIDGEHFAAESRFDHDEHGNPVVVLNARDGRIEFDYDPEAHIFVVAERQFPEPDRPIEWHAEYDRRFGGVTKIDGPNGEKHGAAYDALGRVTKVAHPGDTLDLPTNEYQYELGAPVSVIREHTRERAGEPSTITEISYVDGFGRERASLREAAEAGRWVLESLLRYGARGKPVFVGRASIEPSNELPQIQTGRDGSFTHYDALLRETGMTHPDGAFTQIEYLPLGRRVWDENDTDPQSPHYDTPNTFLSDGLGRLHEVIERKPEDLTTGRYSYDALGNPTAVEDAAGNVRTYRYDGASRRTELVDPNAGTWRFEYSDADELVRRIDPTGSIIRYEHDALGRVRKEFHQPGGGAEVLASEFHYDAPASGHAELRNLRGRLAWVRDEVGEVFHGYNQRGLSTETIRRFADGSERTSWTDYDSANRVVRRGFPDHTYYETNFDARGLIRGLGPFANDIEWTADGELARVALGNGVNEERSYDTRERIQDLRATTPAGSTVRALRIDYDGASLIRGFTDLAPNPSAELDLTARFEYNHRSQLTAMTDRAGVTLFTHDAMSNLLSVSSPHSAPELNTQNEYGQSGTTPDQISRQGDRIFSYDAAGRMTSDGTRTFDWDAKGRLARVEQGDIAEEYVYGHDDTRVVKRTTRAGRTSEVRYLHGDAEERAGGIIRYVSLDEERLARLDPVAGEPSSASSAAPAVPPSLPGGRGLWAAAIACATLLLLVAFRTASSPLRPARIFGALIPIALVLSCGDDDAPAGSKDPRAGARRIDTLPAGTIFYSANHQETPLALTNAAGEVVAERRVFPYGSVRVARGEAGEPYGFVGNELDAVELSISDFHARPYDARLGLFLAPDPIAVFEPEKTLELPLGLSAYAYAGGNPITDSDPTGLCPQCVTDDLMKREQEMLRHPDPKVREAGRGVLRVKLELLLAVVPVPAGPAARLVARYAPKAYRLAQAARAAAASGKAARAAKAAAAMASKGLEKVKGLVGAGAKKAAEAGAARAGPRSVGAAAAQGTFRSIAGTRGLEHSFSRHAAQWFGREVPASTHMARWQNLIERAAGSGKQVDWSVGGEATVGHLARIEGKYFFAQFYKGGPRAGELATAFVPNQTQLGAILKALP